MVWVFMTSTLKADYTPPSLTELVLFADKILYGEIHCVDDAVIEVNVHDSVHHDSKSITIDKFMEWDCGRRWKEYEVGDRSLFFLGLSNGRYRVLGGGNEGELPIHGKKIYVHASTLSKAGFSGQFERSGLQREYHGYNDPYNGYAMDLNDFWQATVLFKKCFKSDVDETGNLIHVQQVCADKDYAATLKQNKIFAWSITELKN